MQYFNEPNSTNLGAIANLKRKLLQSQQNQKHRKNITYS